MAENPYAGTPWVAEADLTQSHAPSSSRALWTLAIVLAAVILSGVDRHVLTLLVHPIEAELRVSDTQISLLQGMAFILVHAVATVLIGWLADHRNRRDILFVGVAFWSAMTGFSALARTFLNLLLLRGGVGVGEAAIVPAGFSLVADHFAPERRGAVTGLLSAAMASGAGLALVTGGFVLSLIGPEPHVLPVVGVLTQWRATFAVLGLAGVPMALIILTLSDVRYRRGRPNGASVGPGPIVPLSAYLRSHWRTFSAVLGAAACNAIVGVGTASWAPTLLIRRFGLSAAHGGYYIGTSVIIGGVVGSIGATTLSDRWIRRRAYGGRLRGHPAIMALAMAGMALFAYGPGPLVCAIGYVGLSIGVNGVSALSYTAVQDLTPDGARARMLGLTHFVAALLGYAAGPTLIALVTDYGYRAKDALPLSLVTVSAPLYLVGAVLAVQGFGPYSTTYMQLNPRNGAP